MSRQVREGHGTCHCTSVCLPPTCAVILTIAFEECIKGGLFASSTELLSVVHQSLFDCIVSIKHHNPARPKVDGEHRAIVLLELMWGK